MRLWKLALVVGVAALLSAPALAQRGRGFGRGFGGPGALLGIEKVQKDLDLDKDTVQKATEALQKVMEDHRDDFAKLADATPEERAEFRKKLAEDQNKALKGVLSEKQQKRLQQIERQQAGINTLSEADVQKELKLTDEQKDKIKDIQKDLTKDTDPLQFRFEPGVKPDFEKMQENQKKIAALRQEALTNAKKVLTADQKKQYEELLGKDLELKPEDFFGGRRGGKPPDKPRTDF